MVVILFSLGYNISRFFEFSYDKEYGTVTTDLRRNEDYKVYYNTVLYMYVPKFNINLNHYFN